MNGSPSPQAISYTVAGDSACAKRLLCPEGRHQCRLALSILTYAHGEELQTALDHARAYDQPREKCRYGISCLRFVRCSSVDIVGTADQKLYNEAHCKMFHHGTDIRPREQAQFCALRQIPRPLQSIVVSQGNLVSEVRHNGFRRVLTTPDGCSMGSIATKMLGHPIHLGLGAPLSCPEVLAILLYTGSAVQSDFNRSRRSGNFSKWQIFSKALHEAIKKLHACDRLETKWRYKAGDGIGNFAHERVSDAILQTWNGLAPRPSSRNTGTFVYTNVDGQKCEFEDNCQQGLVTIGGVNYTVERVLSGSESEFPQYGLPEVLWRGVRDTTLVIPLLPQIEHNDVISTSVSKEVATSARFFGGGPVGCTLFSFTRSNDQDEIPICADISWISKFGEYEQEVLFAPSGRRFSRRGYG